jgi:hydrogenase-4 component E
MTLLASHLYLLTIIAMFICVVFLHLVHKNSTAVMLYAIESAATVLLLLVASLSGLSLLLVIAITTTFIVKVIVAPYFLLRLVRTHELRFTSSSYFNNPLTLLMIGAIVAFTQSSFLKPLAEATQNGTAALIAMAIILTSLFLVMNRKGALSQVLGILSIENGIVAFAVAAGLEQSPGLELGITFDIAVWIAVASIFISMMYRQFGSLDVTAMRRLID